MKLLVTESELTLLINALGLSIDAMRKSLNDKETNAVTQPWQYLLEDAERLILRMEALNYHGR